MPTFGYTSRTRLATCHPELQRLMNEVIRTYDCSIIEGRRDKATQDGYFARKVTKVQWPNSKHNAIPPELSTAVDVVPYIRSMGGQIWPNPDTQSPEDYLRILGAFYMFLGYVQRIAVELGIPIRMGADWDSDRNLLDQKFHDLPHIELRNP